MKDLSDYRKSYEKKALLEVSTPEDPMVLFRDWFFEVEQEGNIEEVNAMHLSTISLDGFPKTRVVLLKKYTYEGFIFYTNYLSEKGKAIAKNPKVCLSFFWHSMERQVIIKGEAVFLAENLSDGYFESRPLGSQLGAIVSPQSEIIPNRDFLEENLKELEKQFKETQPERPKHWGGYLVRPQSIEFWQGRPNRLHDRLHYALKDDFSWEKVRLAP
jgi:pyridoxamine 5'-phosphate oxidase